MAKSHWADLGGSKPNPRKPSSTPTTQARGTRTTTTPSTPRPTTPKPTSPKPKGNNGQHLGYSAAKSKGGTPPGQGGPNPSENNRNKK